MAQHCQRTALDVVRDDEFAAAQQCPSASAAYQRDRGARAGTQRQAGPVARLAGQPYGVVEHLIVHRQFAGDLLQCLHVLRLQQYAQRSDVEDVGPHRSRDLAHHVHFLVGQGIVHAQHQHETIEFGFGQRISALLLDGVLGGHHHERLGHDQRAPLEGDLALLHDFQQRGLGLGRRAVDFVGQQQVGEHRALAQLELLAGDVVHRVAGDVAGHQVRGELDSRELPAEAACQGAYQQCLAETGNALDQHMPPGDQRRQQPIDHLMLADHGLVQFLAQGLRQLAGTLVPTGRRNRIVRLRSGFAHRAFLMRCRWAT